MGDGTEKKCGVTSPTEFSFGGAPNCSACPRGWVRSNPYFTLINKAENPEVQKYINSRG